LEEVSAKIKKGIANELIQSTQKAVRLISSVTNSKKKYPVSRPQFILTLSGKPSEDEKREKI